MTENEAIKELEKFQLQVEHSIAEEERCEYDNLEKALQEDKEFLEAFDMAISALKEIQQYRKIGTVEECREAVEKQKAKKPKDSLKINPVIDGNGAYVDADMTVYLLCPNCGEMIGIDESCDKFCRECGQAIDENLEEME